MANAVVTHGKDTWAGSGDPDENHNKANRLRLDSGTAYGYLWAPSPVPPRRTVVSAFLELHVAKTADWAGTKTLTLRRVADQVPFSKLTWNNKPGVAGATQPTVTVTNATDGQLLRFDVTNHQQTWANGTSNYGWRIETDSGTGHRVYGFGATDDDMRPRLVVEYADVPSTPTDLRPQGGAVSVAKPMLVWSGTDLTNLGDLANIQVQIDPAANATSPAFDSTARPSTVPQLDLTTTSYAGLANNASTQWRARNQNAAGQWSAWSDWVTFSRVNKPVLTVTNPSAGVVTEATPPFLGTFAGLVAFRVQIVARDDHSDVLATSHKVDQAGGNIAWTPPPKVLHDDGQYTLLMDAWDGVDRVATPGDPIYTRAVVDFTMDDDVTLTPPTNLVATQDGGTPWVILTWTEPSSGDPDSWTISMDGKNIATKVLPGDTLVAGSTHQYRVPLASPMTTHHYGVRAVVNGKSSTKALSGPVMIVPEGVWVLDTDRDLWFTLSEVDSLENWRETEQVAVYRPLGRPPVQIRAGMNGAEGDFAGILKAEEGRTAADMEVDLRKIRKVTGSTTMQLVAADLSAEVLIRNLSCTPHPDTTEDEPMKLVYFEFMQVD